MLTSVEAAVPAAILGASAGDIACRYKYALQRALHLGRTASQVGVLVRACSAFHTAS